MIRLFVGLALPYEVCERLSDLPRGLPNARLIKPENIHLTLRFIGEVDEDKAADIDEMLAGVRAPAFDLTLNGVGYFGKGHRAHTLWVGVEPNPALEHLQTKMESACVRAGLEPEGRKFTPHVTIAKLHDPAMARLQDYIESHGLLRLDPIPADHFTLFSSHLSHKGAEYTAERDYPLTGPLT